MFTEIIIPLSIEKCVGYGTMITKNTVEMKKHAK
jgi:hypothetical protein